jgi:hypothetical protein
MTTRCTVQRQTLSLAASVEDEAGGDALAPEKAPAHRHRRLEGQAFLLAAVSFAQRE